LSGPKSDDKDDIFSGSLRGDSTVRSVLGQIRQILFGESQTKGDKIVSMRDLGVTVDKNGVVSLDEATLDAAVANNFEQVVQALAGRQTTTENGATVIKRGIGSDLAAKLREIMGPSGPVVNQSTSAEGQVRRFKSQLEALETRMEKILERYTKQFAAMESLVGQLTSMRENLKGQFEAMAKSYGK
jgi:flagellar hook-associated protein 2